MGEPLQPSISRRWCECIVCHLDTWGWRVCLFVCIGGPIVWATGYAVAYSLGGVGRLSQGWTLDHWAFALAEPNVMGSLGYSLLLASLVTLIVSGLSLALLFAYPRIRHSRTLLLGLALLLGTPPLVVGQITSNALGSGGWLSRLSYHLGWIEAANHFPTWVNDRWSVGLTLAITVTLLPLALLYFSQLWSSAKIDRRCQLAQSLGATALEGRLKVALPMLLRGGRSLLVLIFILALGSYEIPLLLGRQTPQMFSVATQRLAAGFDLGLKPQAYVLAVMYLVCTSLMLLVYVRMRQTHE